MSTEAVPPPPTEQELAAAAAQEPPADDDAMAELAAANQRLPFAQQPMVQNVLPFVTSVAVHVGILLLAWLPNLPVPRVLGGLAVLLASASMHIYLVHWLVYPLLAGVSLPLAVAASLASGAAYWAVCTRVSRAFSRRRARR